MFINQTFNDSDSDKFEMFFASIDSMECNFAYKRIKSLANNVLFINSCVYCLIHEFNRNKKNSTSFKMYNYFIYTPLIMRIMSSFENIQVLHTSVYLF